MNVVFIEYFSFMDITYRGSLAESTSKLFRSRRLLPIEHACRLEEGSLGSQAHWYGTKSDSLKGSRLKF